MVSIMFMVFAVVFGLIQKKLQPLRLEGSGVVGLVCIAASRLPSA